MLRISLFQNRSHRGCSASVMIRLVRPTVLVLSTSNLGKTSTPVCLRVGFEHRLGELPVERRVDDHPRPRPFAGAAAPAHSATAIAPSRRHVP